MRTSANRYELEASVMKTASCSPSSIQRCSTRSLISTAGPAASYATQHRVATRATISSALRVTVPDAASFVFSDLISKFLPQSRTNIEKATSFYQAPCRVMQPHDFFFLLVEHLHSCTSAHHYAYLHMADDVSRSACFLCSWMSTIAVVVGCTIKPPSLIAAEVPLWVIL